MPALRAFLFLITVAGGALLAAWSAHGQRALPPDLTRRGNVVMMQPIPDGGAHGGESGPHPSAIRVLTPTDHDLFVRAFDAAAHGDWTGARSLAAGSTNRVARQLLEWRYVLDPDSGASFAEIEA
ncbi:MAG TPA: hypothetical protein VHV26_03595, partial [Rhizomicrobium sp.]|nr:hypothetical protein [Rhizomicrobium sp.]